MPSRCCCGCTQHSHPTKHGLQLYRTNEVKALSCIGKLTQVTIQRLLAVHFQFIISRRHMNMICSCQIINGLDNSPRTEVANSFLRSLIYKVQPHQALHSSVELMILAPTLTCNLPFINKKMCTNGEVCLAVLSIKPATLKFATHNQQLVC